jgi:hypothetical protein
LEESLS